MKNWSWYGLVVWMVVWGIGGVIAAAYGIHPAALVIGAALWKAADLAERAVNKYVYIR